jgi:hypothetical protein
MTKSVGRTTMIVDGKEVFHRALHRQVLAVAVKRTEGTWKAYIAPVPGENHENEVAPVVSNGVPLMEDVARAIFPYLKDVPYAR